MVTCCPSDCPSTPLTDCPSNFHFPIIFDLDAEPSVEGNRMCAQMVKVHKLREQSCLCIVKKELETFFSRTKTARRVILDIELT